VRGRGVGALMGVVIGCASAISCATASPPARTGEPAPIAPPRAPSNGPAYYMVEADDVGAAVVSRRTALMAAGQRLRADELGYYMDVQEARLRQVAAAGVLVTREDERVMLSLPGALAFDVGSATLTEAAMAAVRALARVLVEYRLSIVAVHGHTDASGDSVSNHRLSEQRALAVARHLMSAGVSSERIVIAGFGAIAPLASNATAEGREANRRVELHVTPLGP
jgi:outer membrane protein OmpA-like peptidoglycan-associated protein